jgi:hypothetical protein
MKKTALLVAALGALTLMGCAGRYYDADPGYYGPARGHGYYGDRERWDRDRAYRDDHRDYRDRYYGRYDGRY